MQMSYYQESIADTELLRVGRAVLAVSPSMFAVVPERTLSEVIDSLANGALRAKRSADLLIDQWGGW
jgi:hypothetical protein